MSHTRVSRSNRVRLVIKWRGVPFVGMKQGYIEWRGGRKTPSLAPRGKPPAAPPAVITLNVVNSLLGLLTWWLDEGSRYSAEDVDRMFRVMVKPRIAAALRSTYAGMQL